MPTTSTIVTASLLVFIAVFAGSIYLFGIPKQLKRQMEEKALETMGENKASYMMKDAIGQIPDDDQQEVKELKSSISKATGGALQNPLGKFAGNTADEGTRGFTGR